MNAECGLVINNDTLDGPNLITIIDWVAWDTGSDFE